MKKRTLAPRLAAGALTFIISLGITPVPFSPYMGTAQTSGIVVYAAENDFVFDAESGYITAYKGSDRNVKIPRTINGVSVKGIEWGAFSGNTSVNQVTIPETVNFIGSMAFEGCTALTTIAIPSGVTEIAPYTFYGCQKLANVQISNTVKRIMLEAFGGCSSLKNITIPASVKTIEKDAFSSIESLTIIGEKGSYAETYAKDTGMKFTESGEIGENDLDQTAANKVIAKIKEIGDVTLQKRDTVIAARNDYDKLTPGQQALVTNYDTLTAAETKLENLIEQAKEEANDADHDEAEKVIKLINALGAISPESKSDIEDIRRLYNGLTDTQKALVTNYSDFMAAESKLAELESNNGQENDQDNDQDSGQDNEQGKDQDSEQGNEQGKDQDSGQDNEQDKNQGSGQDNDQDADQNQPNLTLSKTKYTLYTKGNRTLTLTASYNSTKLGKTSVTWKSSKPGVASVSKSGKITAKKKGKATISATYKGVTAKCTITVKKPTLKLKKSKASLKVGKKVQIPAKATPAKKITYRSQNKRIATVSKKGVVTAKSAGKTTITVTANGVKKRFTVTVSK